MISQINSISFQGKFITPMQGRNGILKDIPAVFERKTNGFEGSLELLRANNGLLISYNNNLQAFKLRNYGDLTGEYIKEKTPENIEHIAESLAKFFKVLKAQDSYNKVLKKLKRSRAKAESALSANKKTCQQAQAEGNKAIETMCLDIIKKNNKKLQELDISFRQAESRYLNFIKNLAGNDIRAQECVRELTSV